MKKMALPKKVEIYQLGHAISKGSLISEGILILDILPKKVPNLAPEQKV